MKPVLIQTLIKKMRDRIRLPDIPSAKSQEPEHKDRTASFIVTVFIIAIIVMFILF